MIIIKAMMVSSFNLKSTENKEWHPSEKRIEKLIISHFSLTHHKIATHCCQDRFDIAIAEIDESLRIKNLIGIEIKSKNDTLQRLNHQIAEYIQIFDYFFIAMEDHYIPESLPPFVGIIKIDDDHVMEERKAQMIGKCIFPWCITSSTLMRTIKKSNGTQSRYMELKAYLEVLDDLRRKLIYNSIFWNDCLPFTKREKKLINFIGMKSKSIMGMGLFEYEYGKTRIAAED